MKIAIGSDHAGYLYKEEIKKLLLVMDHDIRDFGAWSEAPVDYPLIIGPVADAVSRGRFDRGIVLGGTGNGEAMVANRFKGIRCALCQNAEAAFLARSHNDANMISIGARLVSLDEALEMVKVWLQTPFEGGRHLRRILQMNQIDRIIRSQKSAQEGDSPTANGDIGTGCDTVTAERDTYDVLIALRYMIYSEGKNKIELRVDPSLKGPTVIHVPSLQRWESEMGEWARGRREEILRRIQSKCAHMVIEWKAC